MPTKNEIDNTVNGMTFTGTEGYYRWSGLFQNCVLTDGSKWLAENAECYWLMDVIASWQPKVRRKPGSDFQVWTLTVTDHIGKVLCTDGNDNRLCSQVIPYTDFPLDKVKLYAAPCEGMMVIYLPSEH